MEISNAVREYLNAPRFAVLATVNQDGSVQQTVMWYLLDGDTLVMNSTGSRRKTANLRRDPRVSVCVSDGYRFVTLTGRATLSDDQTVSQADILKLAVRYEGEEQGKHQAAEVFSKQRRVSIRVPIEHVLDYGVGE